jgi:hypothetical protein
VEVAVDRAGAVPRAVVLVEGISDRVALEALARRRGRALDAAGVSVVAMGGATNIGRYLERFGPAGLDVRLAGRCDAAEEPYFRRALGRAGLGTDLSRADLEAGRRGSLVRHSVHGYPAETTRPFGYGE